MKGVVIFVVLLIVSMPISMAKEVAIPELFEAEEDYVSDSGKEVYYYAGSKLIAVNDEYKFQDRLGSDYESRSLPFGQVLNVDNRFSFTGKELDQDLYYFDARYYDSDLGKFTSVDPVKDEPPYSYVYNNPLIYTDPAGTEALLEKGVYYTEELALGRRVSTLSLGEFANRNAPKSYPMLDRGAPYRFIGIADRNIFYFNTHGAPGVLQKISVWRSIFAIRRNPNIGCVGVSACHSTQTAAAINLFTGRPALGYMGSFYGYDSTRDVGYLVENRGLFRYTRHGKPHIGMVFSGRGTSASYLGVSGFAAALGYVGAIYFLIDTTSAIRDAETPEEKAIEVTSRASGLAAASQTAPAGAALGAELGSPLGPLGLLGGGILGGIIGGGIGYFGGEITGDIAARGAMEQGRREAEAASSGDINDIIGFADWGGP